MIQHSTPTDRTAPRWTVCECGAEFIAPNQTWRHGCSRCHQIAREAASQLAEHNRRMSLHAGNRCPGCGRISDRRYAGTLCRVCAYETPKEWQELEAQVDMAHHRICGDLPKWERFRTKDAGLK